MQADLGLPVGFDVGFDPEVGAVSMAVDLSAGAELVTYNESAEPSSVEDARGLLAQPLVTGLVDSSQATSPLVCHRFLLVT